MPIIKKKPSKRQKPTKGKVSINVGAKVKKKGTESDSTRLVPMELPRNNVVNFKIKMRRKEK